jgi:hypothetical protein
MCGRLRGARVDAMVMTATGSIDRRRFCDLNDAALGSRIAVRMHTHLIHE